MSSDYRESSVLDRVLLSVSVSLSLSLFWRYKYWTKRFFTSVYHRHNLSLLVERASVYNVLSIYLLTHVVGDFLRTENLIETKI